MNAGHLSGQGAKAESPDRNFGRCEESHMAKKKVKFQTRAGTYIGTIVEKYQTAKGEFAKVLCSDSKTRSVRPSQLTAA
jgi:hypothetical protein